MLDPTLIKYTGESNKKIKIVKNDDVPTKSTNLFLRTVRLETMRTRGRITERSVDMEKDGSIDKMCFCRKCMNIFFFLKRCLLDFIGVKLIINLCVWTI